MNLKNQNILPPDKKTIEELDKLYRVADSDHISLVEFLQRLNFIKSSKRLSLFKRYINGLINFLDTYLDPISVVGLTILSALIFKNVNCVRMVFLVLAFIITYIHWLKSQRSKNVEDAMARKDKANSMIIDNAELLYPYIGNVFDFRYRYREKQIDQIKLTKINMYVFTEIDNLEFVFEKSRSGLIEEIYALRAIKIFIARAENKGFFRIAQRLLETGRYNDEFKNSVQHLLYLGRLYPYKS